MAQARGHWSGSYGFILAAIGSAVGLGNIWRFSFVAGQNGGAAFVLVYLGCVLAVGIPVMLAEFLIGRHTQRNVVGSFHALRPGSAWALTGWLPAAASFIVLSYYAVVGGWVLHYIALSLTNSFAGQSAETISGLFTDLTTSGLSQLGWHAVFMLVTVVVVVRGVAGGLERGNKIMMPLLFVMLCGLLVYAVQTDGAQAGIAFLLSPRWDQLTARSVLEAMGQAFFSLSIAGGIMITYGSYMRKETDLVRPAFYIAGGDTLVALLSGLMIFPLVFTFQLEPSAGPGLIFQVLPTAFAQLPAGQLLALVFFVLLSFAALSSAISLLEVVVAYAIDEQGWSRSRATWGIGGVIFLCGIPSALSADFFGVADRIVTNYMLPTGGLLIAVFTGWILSQTVRREEFMAGGISERLYAVWIFLIRYVSPVAVAIILLQSLAIF